MPETPIQFKDSPLGKIPEDWDVVSLSSLFQIQTGATPLRNRHQAYFAGGKIPWVKTMDLNEGWITQTDECITEVALRECSVQLLPPKTVLVAMYGGWEQIGRTSILRDAATTNQAISSLVKISPFIEPEFALRALQYERHRWKGIAASTRKDPNITRDDVENFLIPLPPLSEQQDIAAILDTIDSTIAHTSTLIAKLKQMKAGLLHDLLTHGLDENGKLRDAIEHPEQFKDSPLGQIPKDWTIRSVGELFDMQLGKMLSKASKTGRNPFPYLANRNVQWDRVDLSDLEWMDFSEEERQKFSLISGDLLVCEGGEVGRTAIWQGEMEDCYFQKAIHRLRPKNLLILPNYMLRFMHQAVDRGFLTFFTSQTSIAHLTREKFALLPLPLPSMPEQKAIVHVLNTHDARIRQEEAYLNKLKEQKKGLMHDLLTGRVRVTDLKEIPA